MRDKWRKLGSPQSIKQKEFVHNFYKPFLYSARCGEQLCNTSEHPVEIPRLGKFKNAQFAFYALNHAENPSFIARLVEGVYDKSLIGEEKVEHETRVENMRKVLALKFEQHPSLKKFLVNTGLRPLVKFSEINRGDEGANKNIHGKLLMELRETFLLEENEL